MATITTGTLVVEDKQAFLNPDLLPYAYIPWYRNEAAFIDEVPVGAILKAITGTVTVEIIDDRGLDWTVAAGLNRGGTPIGEQSENTTVTYDLNIDEPDNTVKLSYTSTVFTLVAVDATGEQRPQEIRITELEVQVTYQIGEVPPPVPPTPPTNFSNLAFEMERGFSFDGNYISHFLELNWFFGDNPVDFTGLQKVRIHGLAKGLAQLSVAANGMETDEMDYEPYYSEGQYIDLPRESTGVSGDYFPVTNTTDLPARGISIQLMFKGRNEDVTLPEPSHVIQVLVLQTTQTGARSN